MAVRTHVLNVLAFGMALSLPAVEAAQAAGAIERACRQSDRRAASASLCRCIQTVAETRLSRSDRRVVSKWILDPQEAQNISRSDRRSDERLWERYKRFGAAAARSCG